MRTPQKYLNNFKQGIITKEMLTFCLFSSNKRAKNCRDKIREYKRTLTATIYTISIIILIIILKRWKCTIFKKKQCFLL